MNYYRQSILLFGFALPALAAAALVGVVLLLKSNASESFLQKQTLFKSSESNRISALALENQISKKRDDMDRWQNLLNQETASATTTNLRLIAEKIPSKEFQLTSFDRTNGAGGFASVAGQRSSQVHLAFRANYRSMQRAFLELETRMPQLQLQDLHVDPSSQSASLNIQVTYTAWEN